MLFDQKSLALSDIHYYTYLTDPVDKVVELVGGGCVIDRAYLV